MRKLFSLSVVGVLALTLSACDEQPTEPATAELPSVTANHGADGVIEASAVYRAVDTEAAELNGLQVGERVGTLSVTDDGSNLTVEGSADGLNPDGVVYVSLFYDKASSAQGPEACEPRAGFAPESDHPLALTLGQMEIGPGSSPGPLAWWDVANDGSATLGPTSTQEYVSADMIGTVSIRDARVNDGFGPDAVVACGSVTHDPAVSGG